MQPNRAQILRRKISLTARSGDHKEDRRFKGENDDTQNEPQTLSYPRWGRPGLYLARPFRKSLGGSAQITIGTEAGSPYDTFYRKHAPEFTARPVSRSLSMRYPMTAFVSNLSKMRFRKRAASTSTSPIRSGCRNSTRKDSSQMFQSS